MPLSFSRREISSPSCSVKPAVEHFVGGIAHADDEIGPTRSRIAASTSKAKRSRLSSEPP